MTDVLYLYVVTLRDGKPQILASSCHYIHERVQDLKGIASQVTSSCKLRSLLLLDSLLSFG